VSDTYGISFDVPSIVFLGGSPDIVPFLVLELASLVGHSVSHTVRESRRSQTFQRFPSHFSAFSYLLFALSSLNLASNPVRTTSFPPPIFFFFYNGGRIKTLKI